MAEKKKKGTWRPKAFCRGVGEGVTEQTQPPARISWTQPVLTACGVVFIWPLLCSETSRPSLLSPNCPQPPLETPMS